MEKAHHIPISVMINCFATRVPGHMPVGCPCGTWMHYAMRDVKDVGQQIGLPQPKWNRLKEAMNLPFGPRFVDGA